MGKEFEPINTVTGLKKTYDDAIEEASAFLLRNTYPTYSKVPPAIQTLRKLPMGNFIAFPAEIVRTATRIIDFNLNNQNITLYQKIYHFQVSILNLNNDLQ